MHIVKKLNFILSNSALPKHLTIFAVAVSVSIGGALPILLVPKAEAGSPALQSILDSITDTCKEMNKGSDRWKSCEEKQGKLATVAGCSEKMFEQKDGKWSAKPQALTDCQKKINDGNNVAARVQPLLDKIKTCTEVGGLEFKSCEAAQNVLQIIGCSNRMFEEVDGGWSYKSIEAKDCQNIIDTIKSSPDTKPGQVPAATEGTGSAQPDCDATGSSPLSWIICPVVDLGANFTDFVFKDIVSPLLRDIPISSDSGDAGYIAWKQFRLIGNILLVGALLAVVYAQAKGDK